MWEFLTFSQPLYDCPGPMTGTWPARSSTTSSSTNPRPPPGTTRRSVEPSPTSMTLEDWGESQSESESRLCYGCQQWRLESQLDQEERKTLLRLNTILSMFNNPQYYNAELTDIWVLSTWVDLKIVVTRDQAVTDPPDISVPTRSTSSGCWPSTTWAEDRRAPPCWPSLEKQVNKTDLGQTRPQATAQWSGNNFKIAFLILCGKLTFLY